MGLFEKKQKSPLYHAQSSNNWGIAYATTEELQRWSEDPNCIEKEECARILAERLVKEEALRLEREQRLAAKRGLLEENPFDPRTELSADARHIASRIVTNLWIIFVALPFVLGILYAILK